MEPFGNIEKEKWVKKTQAFKMRKEYLKIEESI